MYKLSYGLFVLTAREDEKDNGCIINTAIQADSGRRTGGKPENCISCHAGILPALQMGISD